MAATEHGALGAVLAAALALPGVMAQAETTGEEGVVSVKTLHYQDRQPGLKRVSVNAPSIYVLAPVNTRWTVEGSLVVDSVSGASPRYHTAISGASRMNDRRTAGDVKFTFRAPRHTIAFGMASSSEHDYRSNAFSLDASFATEDQNRSWNIGVGASQDRIGSSNDLTLRERRQTTELMVGMTQAWTPVDLVQANLSFTRGRGYFSDPYKEPDIRPRERDQAVFLLRWNHHLPSLGATWRTSYRYYADTFGVRAHTLTGEWVQPLNADVSITPLVRVYSQRAASFYYDPVYDPGVGAPYPPGYFTNPPTYISADQRLAAFGGLTLGAKLAWQVNPKWSTDLKLEWYEQRSGWRLGGSGSPGLAPFSAGFAQFGLNAKF